VPELPEVETVRRTLVPHLVGVTLAAVRVRERRLRVPVNVASLRQLAVGQTIAAVRRRGKYLIIDLRGGTLLLVHLGMSGRLTLESATQPLARHDHVVFSLSDGRELRYNDPRRFGLIVAMASRDEAQHPLLARLGVEPLSPEFSGALLFALTRHSRQPIKTFLLDAHRVVGVGNIYASEALAAARLHPARAAHSLSGRETERLAAAIRDVLERAIARGGTTLRDFVDGLGVAGDFANALAVYGRDGEPCVRCRRRIRSVVQAGRRSFFCPGCQRSR